MSPNPPTTARRGEAALGRALNERWVERLARAGILSRAANYIVLAILAAAILLGHGGKQVDKRGAVEAIAGAPFGRVLLILLCVGVLAYVAWQLFRAATRRGDQSGAADAGRRLLAAATAVIYVGFLVTIVRVLSGSSTASSQVSQDSLTARALSASGGRILVAAAGCAVIAAGLGLTGYAVSRKFERGLDTASMGRSMRRAAAVLGIAGQAGRGLVFVIIGGFVLSAALADDASRSKGLDGSVRTLAGEPFGWVLIGLVALGFLAFGLYSLVDARYRSDFSR